MGYWDAVLAFVAAMAVAVALTPASAWLARRVGALAQPIDRGVESRPTPALGGLAILLAALVAIAIWIPGLIHIPKPPHSGHKPAPVVHTWTIAAGAIVIALIGALDDWRDLRPEWKLLGQVTAAVIAVLGGVVVTDVTLPFIGSLQFPSAGGAISVIWLVVLMNVVNFSDGMDGLAAGLTAIDGVAFAIIAFDLHVPSAAVLAALTAGAALGFLFYNFPPASVFMGDSGANLLGYLLGIVAVIGSVKTNAVVALAMPLVVLAVPFLDTGFVVAKRLKYRRAPWDKDANHFHHRMARIGFSQRRAVAYLLGWTALLAVVAVALRFVPYSDHRRHYRLGWSLVMAALGLGAVAASVYLVYVLEILKFRTVRTFQLRRSAPETSEHEVEEQIRRELETGEFERVR